MRRHFCFIIAASTYLPVFFGIRDPFNTTCIVSESGYFSTVRRRVTSSAMARLAADALACRLNVYRILLGIIVSERVYISAVRRSVASSAMARLAAGVIACRGDVFGVFFGVIMSEGVDCFILRLAAHFARVRSFSLGFATGCNCFSPFTPNVSGRNDLAFGCAAHFAFTSTLAVLCACSRRGVSPFAPCVRVFPYRIQRYVGAHRVGQDIPHLLAGCVERKADKPRTLLGRKSELSYDLSVLDRNIGKNTSALRIECHSETYCFISGIFTAGIISRSFSAGSFSARSLLSGSAAVVAGGEDADGEDKAARQRDDEKQLPFHDYLPRAKNRPFFGVFFAGKAK